MISIPVQARIFTIPIPTTAGNDIDDQISACNDTGLNPYSGDLFVFKDIESTRIGVLSYDGHGFQWCIKRFSDGKLAWWPSEAKVSEIAPRDLQVMLWGGNPEQAKFPPMWRPLIKMTDTESKQ